MLCQALYRLGTATVSVSESTQWFAQQSPQAVHQPQPSPRQQPGTELQQPPVVEYAQVQMSPQPVETSSPSSTTYTELLPHQQQSPGICILSIVFHKHYCLYLVIT